MVDVQLYLGDCLEILPTLVDNSVDAVITDIPYGTTQCKWDEVIPLDEMWRQVKQVTGIFITTASQPFTSKLVISNLDWFRYEWIWHKNHPSGHSNSNRVPMKVHENILIFYKKLPTFNKIKENRDANSQSLNRYKYKMSLGTGNGIRQTLCPRQRPHVDDIFMRNPTTVQYFKCVPRVFLDHPTQKPAELYEYLIRTYTNEGDTVLDITMGSGTTGVACVQTGRNFIGIEIDPKYFEIAEKRIAEAQLQIRMEI